MTQWKALNIRVNRDALLIAECFLENWIRFAVFPRRKWREMKSFRDALREIFLSLGFGSLIFLSSACIIFEENLLWVCSEGNWDSFLIKLWLKRKWAVSYNASLCHSQSPVNSTDSLSCYELAAKSPNPDGKSLMCFPRLFWTCFCVSRNCFRWLCAANPGYSELRMVESLFSFLSSRQ